MEIPTCFQDPHKSEKVSPRPPTDSKMTPKTLPLVIKFMNKWKNMKPSQKQSFYNGLTTYRLAFWHHFHPRITKNMNLETVSNFATQNHGKVTKCPQRGSQETPIMHSKIDKNEQLDLKVPIGCPCGPLDHQKGHSRHQNGISRSPK